MNAEILSQLRSKPYFTNIYDPIEVLGKGGFGIVVKVRKNLTGELIALKIATKKHDRTNWDAKNEVEVHKKLVHPNIVKFISSRESKNRVYIELELMNGGNLRNYVKEKAKLSEDEAASILKGILTGVKYLHSQNIIHRDIKLENVLLGRECTSDTIKISDFGLSVFYDSPVTCGFNKKCGTNSYMAPEQIRENGIYTRHIDAWSCGILCYKLLHYNSHPFVTKDSSDPIAIAEQIMENPLEFKEGFEASELCKDFISRMLRKEPIMRYSVEQALTHPWITRNLDDPIPMKNFEMCGIYEASKDIKLVLRTLLFLKSIGITKAKPINKKRKTVRANSLDKTRRAYLKVKSNYVIPQAIKRISLGHKGVSTKSRKIAQKENIPFFYTKGRANATVGETQGKSLSRDKSRNFLLSNGKGADESIKRRSIRFQSHHAGGYTPSYKRHNADALQVLAMRRILELNRFGDVLTQANCIQRPKKLNSSHKKKRTENGIFRSNTNKDLELRGSQRMIDLRPRSRIR